MWRAPPLVRGSGGRDGCVWRAGAYLGGVERARDGDCLAVTLVCLETLGLNISAFVSNPICK